MSTKWCCETSSLNITNYTSGIFFNILKSSVILPPIIIERNICIVFLIGQAVTKYHRPSGLQSITHTYMWYYVYISHTHVHIYSCSVQAEKSKAEALTDLMYVESPLDTSYMTSTLCPHLVEEASRLPAVSFKGSNVTNGGFALITESSLRAPPLSAYHVG